MTRKTITTPNGGTAIELGRDAVRGLTAISRFEFPALSPPVRASLKYLGLVRFHQVGITGGAEIPRITAKGRAWLRAKPEPPRLDTSSDGLKPPVKTAPAGPKSLADIVREL